jgi:ARC6-like, IMS domain
MLQRHQCTVLQQRATVQRVAVQEAKAAALGPRHQVNTLAEVLAEPLLKTVQQQANTAAANGWFWTYRLDGVKVPCPRGVREPESAAPSALRLCICRHLARHKGTTAQCTWPRGNSAYHRSHTQVEYVRPAPPADVGTDALQGPAAVVTARLHEAADVWNDQGRKGDSYASTYKVGLSLCACDMHMSEATSSESDHLLAYTQLLLGC